jgi:hypothetical protein
VVTETERRFAVVEFVVIVAVLFGLAWTAAVRSF